MSSDQVIPKGYCSKAVLYAESTVLAIIQLTDIVLTIFALIHAVSLVVTQLRSQIMYRTYRDPCDLLIPTWLILTLRVPQFVYVFGMPVVHFCSFVERTLATFFVKRYEVFGNWLGWIFALFTWTTVFFILYFLFHNEDFLAPRIYCGVTSEHSASSLLKIHYIVLFFDLGTTVGDIVLYIINKKQRNVRVVDYSLSKSYQLNENTVALKWLLPLSFCHSICFSLYSMLSLIARQFGDGLDLVGYMETLEGSYVLMPIHIDAMLAMMIYLMKKKPKPLDLRRPSGTAAHEYFKHLKQQWGITVISPKTPQKEATRRHYLRNVQNLYKKS